MADNEQVFTPIDGGELEGYWSQGIAPNPSQPLDPGDRGQWIPEESGLPPGVHPYDPSTAWDPSMGPEIGSHPDHNFPVTQDTAGSKYAQGRKPWSIENDDALPVFQRSSHELAVGVAICNTNNGGTNIIVGRNRGRSQLRLWLPPTTGQLVLPNGTIVTGGALLGCMVSAVEGELQNGGGVIVNPGDAPLILPYEGSVYIGLIPGNVVGYCQFANMFNPPGGGLGGQ